MNRPMITAALGLSLGFASFPGTAAQPSGAAPAEPRQRTVQPGGPVPPGQGGIMAIREYPSNQQSNVDTDRFIGYPDNVFTNVWNGMMTRSMLRAGDPYKPGPQGEVLEYRDDLAVAYVEPHAETGTAESPGYFFYYVQEGVGRIDTGPGSKTTDIRPGVGILIAPGTRQHFVNTGDAQLSMIMLSWQNNDGMTAKAPIKVVDTNTEPLGANRAHWVMTSKHLFDGNDGVNITAGAIRIPPNSYSGPHAHWKGVEEVWVKTGADMGYAILGSEIREIDGPGAFLAPPNGLTTHSSMNLNKDHAAIWLYLSRRLPGGGGGERQ
jgi:mannose-6-phosphate isomerase-like protein (cupin superfamily)